MTTVNDIKNAVELAAPTSLRLPWDNDGLQVCENPAAEVKKCLICLDVTDKAIDKAIETGAGMIVTHHPLFFRKTSDFSENEIHSRLAIRMIRNGISQLSAHTRLDIAPGGTGDTVCDLLGIRDAVCFDDEHAGKLGYTDEITFGDFCKKVKKVLNVPYIRYTEGAAKVKTVAVLTGNGNDDLMAAKKAGADVFLTGDITYNWFVEAYRMNFSVIDAGHYFTEFPVCKTLERIINTACPDVSTQIYPEYPIKEELI